MLSISATRLAPLTRCLRHYSPRRTGDLFHARQRCYVEVPLGENRWTLNWYLRLWPSSCSRHVVYRPNFSEAATSRTTRRS